MKQQISVSSCCSHSVAKYWSCNYFFFSFQVWSFCVSRCLILNNLNAVDLLLWTRDRRVTSFTEQFCWPVFYHQKSLLHSQFKVGLLLLHMPFSLLCKVKTWDGWGGHCVSASEPAMEVVTEPIPGVCKRWCYVMLRPTSGRMTSYVKPTFPKLKFWKCIRTFNVCYC